MSTLPMDRSWSRAQVAAFFGQTETWLDRHMKDLRARAFPEPLPGRRWDPLAILAWRLAQLPPELRDAVRTVIPSALPGNPLDAFSPEAWAAELDRKAVALGQVGGSAE